MSGSYIVDGTTIKGWTGNNVITHQIIDTNITSIDDSAFCYKGYTFSITGLEFPNTLETIGSNAYENTDIHGNLNMSNLVNLTSIANYAFYGCTGLTGPLDLAGCTVLDTIGQGCFQNCYQLESLTLPSSLTTIGVNAFDGCTGLTGPLDLEDTGLDTIGQGCFYDCYQLTSLTLPSSLTSIGDGSFSGCTGLTGPLDLEDTGLVTLENNCFRNCYQLESLTLPSSLTSIGVNAFQECTGLTGPLNLEDTGLDTIGQDCFRDCNQLESLTLPSSLTSIGLSAFQECTGLTGPLDLAGCTGLLSLGNDCFQNCNQLESLTLPSSLTTIGDYSFYECAGLTDIYFNSSITLLSTSFSNSITCTVYANNNDNFTIGSGTSGTFSINNNPLSIFFDNWRLYDYPYPDTDTDTCYSNGNSGPFSLNYTPGDTATFYTYNTDGTTGYTITIDGIDVTDNFLQNYSENRVTFTGLILDNSSELNINGNGPMNLILTPHYTVDTNTITGWTGGTDITLQINNDPYLYGYTITSIDDSAFYNQNYTFSITGLEFPNTLETIGNNSYRGTDITGNLNMSYLVNLTSIGNAAFSDCTGLTGPLDLAGCTVLETIGQSCFQNCNQLESLTLPSSLTSIGDGAFSGCTGLTGDLNLSSLNNLNDIFYNTFYNCNQLESLTLPTNLVTLGGFEKCTKLTGSLELKNFTKLTTLYSNAFETCGFDALLTLPNSLSSLGDAVFYACKFSGDLDLSNLSLLTTIPVNTFDKCEFNGKLILSSNLSIIGEKAFNLYSSFTNVYFQKGCTIDTTSFNEQTAIVYAYNSDNFNITDGTSGSFGTTTNPLSSFFYKWRLYDYPYPDTDTDTCYSDGNSGPFTLYYTPGVTAYFYTYSPVNKTDYTITIDSDTITTFTQIYSENMVTFTGLIPDNSTQLYINGNGPMNLYNLSKLNIIQYEVITTIVDVTDPFSIDPDNDGPFSLVFDGKTEPLIQYQFNQCSFTIFDNNVFIEGNQLSSDPLTLSPYFETSKTKNGSIYYTLYPHDAQVYVQLVNALTGEIIGEPVLSTGSYFINNLNHGQYYLRIVNNNLIYDHTIISDICFIKGTIVKTDQGFFSIEKITNQTLYGKSITITKTKHYDPYLVKINAYALGEFPTKDTYMSLKHHILLEKSIMARELINGDTITQVPYDGEPLYNVLVDTHTTMKVHGMLVETLDPNSIVGLFYRSKLSPKQKNKMIKMINEEPIKAKNMLLRI